MKDQTSKKQAESFDRFWDIYPRKVAKGAARRAWGKAVAEADAEVVIEALRVQVAAGAFVPPYVPYPATWLNQERWDDEILPRKPTAAEMAERAASPDFMEQEARFIRETFAEAERDGDKAMRERMIAAARDIGLKL